MRLFPHSIRPNRGFVDLPLVPASARRRLDGAIDTASSTSGGSGVYGGRGFASSWERGKMNALTSPFTTLPPPYNILSLPLPGLSNASMNFRTQVKTLANAAPRVAVEANRWPGARRIARSPDRRFCVSIVDIIVFARLLIFAEKLRRFDHS